MEMFAEIMSKYYNDLFLHIFISRAKWQNPEQQNEFFFHCKPIEVFTVFFVLTRKKIAKRNKGEIMTSTICIVIMHLTKCKQFLQPTIFNTLGGFPIILNQNKISYHL